jgi:hypothetical protein
MDQHPRVSKQKTFITTQPRLKLGEGITKYAFQFYDKSITLCPKDYQTQTTGQLASQVLKKL